MEKHSASCTALLMAVLLTCLQATLGAQPLRLWSALPLETGDQPTWTYLGTDHILWENHSFPLGNGSIGLSMMSAPAAETIILNEKTLWTGGPAATATPQDYWKVNKENAWQRLPEIRKALSDGNDALAQRLTEENFNGWASYDRSEETPFRFGHYTVAGRLKIHTGIGTDTVEDFERSLLLDSALYKVSFRRGKHQWKRSAFVSYPDNVAVLRFEADTVQHLEVEYRPGPSLTGNFKFKKGEGLWTYAGELKDNGLPYVLRMRVEAGKGSKLAVEEGRLRICADGPVVIYLTEDTGYRMNTDPDFKDAKTYTGEQPSRTTAAWIRKASRMGHETLLKRHVEDYGRLAGTFSWALNPDSADYTHEPIEDRLAAYKAGRKDYGLETLYLQYGRYLLISSSRAGNLPANLQGIWADEMDAPWHADYHNNINVQMNYWPALSGNLSECALPYIQYIRSLVEPGRVTAAAYYQAEGWTASISANPYGFTAPLSSPEMTWNLIPAAGPWLAADLWNYYDYTRDLGFLRELAYPIIAESARFVCDYLWEMPDGQFTAAPSTSPEHGAVDLGSSFVHAVCRELLTDALRAHEVLSQESTTSTEVERMVSSEERQEWAHVLAHIAPYQIGRYGQLQEWQKDIDDPADEHRHVNHLFGLHPGREISPSRTPELAKAAKVVLNHRGDGATGWSMGWKLNLWARLQDGDHAYRLFQNLLKEGTYENLWCAHPPFQIDGNFGGAAGLIEMLVQSHENEIALLPALPTVWKSGSLKGAAARGNFTVDLEWKDGKLTRAVIHAGSDGPCRLAYEGQVFELEMKAGETAVLSPKNNSDNFTFHLIDFCE